VVGASPRRQIYYSKWLSGVLPLLRERFGNRDLTEMKLQLHAETLAEKNFLGGRAEVFEVMGRLQLITLLRCGLYPHSRVLDLGCGCLRGGYWLVHFLNPDRYFGIEPQVEMLEIGKTEILGRDILNEKRPRFSSNDRFDPSEFGVLFDFFIARSVWTHASRGQIEEMLDRFLAFGTPDSLFVTSFLPGKKGEGDSSPDWVGRSHESDTPGTRRHELGWIEQLCLDRNLKVRELFDPGEKQVWLLIAKGEGARPAQTYLKRLVEGMGKDKGKGKGVRDSVRRWLRCTRLTRRFSDRHSS